MKRFDWLFAIVLMLGLGLSGCAEQGDTSDEGGGSGPVAPGGSDAAAMAGAPGNAQPPGGMAAGSSGGAGAGAMSPPIGGNAGMAGAPAGSSDPRPAGGNAGTGSAGSAAGTTGGIAGAGGTGLTGGGGGAGDLAGMGSPPPMPLPDYAPSPENPAECPAVAPDNPVGDCLGLPIYLTCEYGDDTYWYVCTCDWYHWLCAGT